MHKRKIYDEEGHAHFVTFSCYPVRRRLVEKDIDWRSSSVRFYKLEEDVGVSVGWID